MRKLWLFSQAFAPMTAGGNKKGYKEKDIFFSVPRRRLHKPCNMQIEILGRCFRLILPTQKHLSHFVDSQFDGVLFIVSHAENKCVN
jgi:hypothetical protein